METFNHTALFIHADGSKRNIRKLMKNIYGCLGIPYRMFILKPLNDPEFYISIDKTPHTHRWSIVIMQGFSFENCGRFLRDAIENPDYFASRVEDFGLKNVGLGCSYMTNDRTVFTPVITSQKKHGL